MRSSLLPELEAGVEHRVRGGARGRGDAAEDGPERHLRERQHHLGPGSRPNLHQVQELGPRGVKLVVAQGAGEAALVAALALHHPDRVAVVGRGEDGRVLAHRPGTRVLVLELDGHTRQVVVGVRRYPDVDRTRVVELGHQRATGRLLVTDHGRHPVLLDLAAGGGEVDPVGVAVVVHHDLGLVEPGQHLAVAPDRPLVGHLVPAPGQLVERGCADLVDRQVVGWGDGGQRLERERLAHLGVGGVPAHRLAGEAVGDPDRDPHRGRVHDVPVGHRHRRRSLRHPTRVEAGVGTVGVGGQDRLADRLGRPVAGGVAPRDRDLGVEDQAERVRAQQCDQWVAPVGVGDRVGPASDGFPALSQYWQRQVTTWAVVFDGTYVDSAKVVLLRGPRWSSGPSRTAWTRRWKSPSRFRVTCTCTDATEVPCQVRHGFWVATIRPPAGPRFVGLDAATW